MRYEKLLKRKHRQVQQQNVSKPYFKNTLRSFHQVKRLPHKTNILQYWRDAQTFTVLHNVAQVILSIPRTEGEVSVSAADIFSIFYRYQNIEVKISIFFRYLKFRYTRVSIFFLWYRFRYFEFLIQNRESP